MDNYFLMDFTLEEEMSDEGMSGSFCGQGWPGK